MKRHDRYMLMEYLDGLLSPAEARRLEARLAGDAALRAELERQRALRAQLAARRPLPEQPWFWDRLAARLDAAPEAEPEPARRGFAPSPAVLSAVLLGAAALATVAVLHRDTIGTLFTRGTEHMQQAYSGGLLKGWIMPLFRQTDKDEALTFAVYGTLPLDERSSTVLRVDPASAQGYRIEVGGAAAPPPPRVTAADLYRAVDARPAQRRALDSLLAAAQRRIESSVLVGDDDAVAIHASLSSLHEDILTCMASTLDAGQRTRFHQYLVACGAGPAALVTARPPVAGLALPRLEPMEQPAFVVMTPRGAQVLQVGVDIDSLRLAMAAEPRVRDMSARFTAIAREYAAQSRELRVVREESLRFAAEEDGRVELRILSDPAGDARRIVVRVRPDMAPLPVAGVSVTGVDEGGAQRVFIAVDSSLRGRIERIPDIDIRIPDMTLLVNGVLPPPPPGLEGPVTQALERLQDEYQRACDQYESAAEELARAQRSAGAQRELLRVRQNSLREALRTQREYMEALRRLHGAGYEQPLPGTREIRIRVREGERSEESPETE